MRLADERAGESAGVRPEAPDVVVLPEAEPGMGGRRLPRWARWALAPALAAALLGGALLFGRSSFFAIDEIRVLGASRLTAARVIREAGIERGANALSVDLGAAKIRLERDPWVASATIERSLPGTITIRVRERVPVVAVQRAGLFDLVAADGTVVVSRPSAGNLPVLTFSAASPTPSSAAPAAIVAALEPSERSDVTAVEVDVLGAVTLQLRAGTIVRFGTPTDLDAKAGSLEAMLRFADENRVRFVSVDLRFPDAPSAVLADGLRYEP